jgi:hypothetical protein
MTGHGWTKHTAFVLGAVAAFVAISVSTEWPWWEYAFMSDNSPVAWLSSALLVANAAIALNLAVSRGLPAGPGYMLAAALAMLACDEQFQLHERLKFSIGGGAAGNAPAWLVGIGGLACLVVLMRIVTSRAARVLIATGVAIGIFALWVDLGTPPAMLARSEELYEVLAESVFLCGLLEISRSQVQSAS